MKKVIAAFDGLKFSESTLSYSIEMVKQAPAHLAGIFLDDISYTSFKIHELIAGEDSPEKKFRQLSKKDNDTRKNAAGRFEQVCRINHLEHTIHHDHDFALKELLHESIYADLLIIDARETLTHYPEKLPTRFIKDLLTEIQCPVLLVPRKYLPVEKIVLLYDGTPASVYAIRIFSYLFEHLKQLPTEVITVKGIKKDMHLPDNRLMKELMKRHFPKTLFTVLKGTAETEITRYLKEENRNSLLVLGAYQRGYVSRWFRPSMADTLMQELKMPLFICHH